MSRGRMSRSRRLSSSGLVLSRRASSLHTTLQSNPSGSSPSRWRRMTGAAVIADSRRVPTEM